MGIYQWMTLPGKRPGKREPFFKEEEVISERREVNKESWYVDKGTGSSLHESNDERDLDQPIFFQK